MKIRDGFVSNSSSSSYIVKFPNIKNFTKEEMLNDLSSEYDWLSDDYDSYFDEEEKKYFEEKRETILKAIEDGFLVKVVDIPYYDEGTNLLKFLKENFDAEVIYDED